MTGDNQSDFDKVTDFGNLYRAYRKSKSGKKRTKSMLRFSIAALDGIYQLKTQLENKTYSITPYRQTIIYEPKKRILEVGSFKDGVVQHSLCDNVILPKLKSEFIQANVAGQIGKGTLYGLDILRTQMLLAYNKYGYDCWIIKGDVKKFFYSIDHNILKDIVNYHFQDDDIWWLCEKFIDSTQSPGVPLGNQLSQVYGLMMLSGFDHFVTGELGVQYYGRYADDFYLIVQSKSHALYCLEAIKLFISTLNLELNNKTQIIPFKNGIKYCGFHTYVTKEGKCIRKLSNENKRAKQKEYRKKIKLVAEGKIKKSQFDEQYNAWKNHISHGNCMKLGYVMDKYIESILLGEDK